MGRCYTAFVIDAYARRILGWSVATTMTSQLVVDAVAQGIWIRHREGKDLTGLVAHHDYAEVDITTNPRTSSQRASSLLPKGNGL